MMQRYNYISAILAFVMWALWAYYINANSENSLISALSQGTASFIITLIMIKMISWFYMRIPKHGIYLVLPALFTVAITSSFVVLLHILVHTKNIFYTVLPTVIVSLLFAFFTTYKFFKSDYRRN